VRLIRPSVKGDGVSGFTGERMPVQNDHSINSGNIFNLHIEQTS